MTISIDSCSIFIPLKWMTYYDELFDQKVATVNLETGDIDLTSIKQNSDQVISNIGFNTYYKRKISNRGFQNPTDGIAISINSKQLRQNYLQGITEATIELIHQEIINQGLIKIEYQDFLNCPISDIDIKQDCPLPKQFKDFNEFSASIHANAKKDIFGKLPLVNRYATTNNQGINFGSRGTSSSIPHFKIYNKEVELQFHSNDFQTEYKIEPINIVRFELNLKNNKQLRKFNLLDEHEQPTLATILSHLGRIQMNTILSIYVNTGAAKTPREKLIEAGKIKKIELQCIKMAMLLLDNTNFTTSEIIDHVINTIEPNKNLVKSIRIMLSDCLEKAIETDADPILTAALNDMFAAVSA